MSTLRHSSTIPIVHKIRKLGYAFCNTNLPAGKAGFLKGLHDVPQRKTSPNLVQFCVLTLTAVKQIRETL